MAPRRDHQEHLVGSSPPMTLASPGNEITLDMPTRKTLESEAAGLRLLMVDRAGLTRFP